MIPKDDLWFPDVDVFVPDDVTDLLEHVHLSPEYAKYCLLFDEEVAYGCAELEIVGRWQQERRAALDAMRYREYLQTPEWGAKRVEALVRDGWRCRVCNSSRSLVVHHRSYERRGHERAEDLTVLCWECHDRYHEGGRLPESS